MDGLDGRSARDTRVARLSLNPMASNAAPISKMPAHAAKYRPGLPTDPSFPNRLLFAGGGLGAGLALGIAIAIWLEIRDRSIRTEKDAAAAMDLPLLVSVPWVSEDEPVVANANGRRSFWGRGNGAARDQEQIEV